jgi:hypothetical protein
LAAYAIVGIPVAALVKRVRYMRGALYQGESTLGLGIRPEWIS